MKPLDDFSPTVREAIVKLRTQPLDPETLDAMVEAIMALVAPKLLEQVNQKLKEVLAIRDAKWRAVVAKLRAEITRLLSRR